MCRTTLWAQRRPKLTVRLVCLACGLLEAREVSPTDGCYRGSHALVPQRVWRKVYGSFGGLRTGSEAGAPQPDRPVASPIELAGVAAGEGQEMQASEEEERRDDNRGERGEEVASPITGTEQREREPAPKSQPSGLERSLEEFVANHWDRWGKFDVDVLLSRAREREPSITNTREFASWLEKNGYTLERVRKKVYAERRG